MIHVLTIKANIAPHKQTARTDSTFTGVFYEVVLSVARHHGSNCLF